MRKTLWSMMAALGIVSFAVAGCTKKSKTDNPSESKESAETEKARSVDTPSTSEAPRPKGDKPTTTTVSTTRPTPTPTIRTDAPPDVAKPPADAKKTASGLAYKVLRPGTGKTHPTATSRVTVHYSGWTTDGKRFDSSVIRGRPITFPLNRVIRGWTEGLQLMVAGEQCRFWIPENLAYGGRPGRPQGMLVFDVELISYQ